MKISLFQGILLGVFGLGALLGLFVFATYTSTNGKNDVGAVVIWGTLPKDDMQDVLTRAAQNDTTLKDASYVEKQPATLSTDLASAIATGNAPDLVLASQEELLRIDKFITPVGFNTVSQSAFNSTFVQGAQIFAGPNGYSGIPFLVDPLALFYNPSILSSGGIAKPPATWEALTGLVPSTTVLTPSRQISRGLIALGTYGNVHDARGILSALFLQMGVPLSSYTATGMLSADLSATASQGEPPGQAVLGFYTQFADPAKISYTWNASLPDSRQKFLAGDLALYLGYASEARYLRSANSHLNFTIAPVPQPAAATVKKTYGLIYAFMIPRGAKNPSGAYQVAASLSGAGAQAIAAGATGLAPAALDALVAPPADPVDAVSYASALYTEGWLSPAPEDTDAVFSGMISDVISGRSTLETALTSAERLLTVLLQQ